MSSPITAKERAYYLATAMLSTAFEYSREDDVQVWWAAFLPHFVSRVLSFARTGLIDRY